MDLKMIQLFEISERFQNIALGKLWSVNFLIIFLLKTKFLTHGQCEHYVNRVVNCLIFGLPVEEYFSIHIEHYGDELIEVFYGICIADHFSTSNRAKTQHFKFYLSGLVSSMTPSILFMFAVG